MRTQDRHRGPWLTRTHARLALVVEMHLVLGPASMLLLVVAMPAFLLGFPHGLGFVGQPLARHDAEALMLMAAMPLAAYSLWNLWELGTETALRARFAFGFSFWLALVAGACAAALVAEVFGPRVWLALAPIAPYVLHMVVLQWRARRPAVSGGALLPAPRAPASIPSAGNRTAR